ncbi:hypothetical protein [Glutamicibacter sp. FBE19]|uniref:hypothetical protein n=1 Tax=Glutamicibacter sp. FBE19 TaxID=2761534 RepID=UPI0018969529|nr:hypothetical protein [Glutamicibacter sp. FBE19]MBF6672437.1 hypothetical protein [Glutamicibacter sp. FBE19]
MSDAVNTEASENTDAATAATEQVQSQDDKPLGENGEKALKAEREARKAAEARLAEFEAKEKEAAKANLSEVERAQAEAKDALEASVKAASELSTYKLAAKLGITDEADMEILLAIPDEATRERTAERIAKAGVASTPKPDLSQGAKGSDKKASTGQQFEDFFNSNLAK